jgi:stage V sporulation protein B
VPAISEANEKNNRQLIHKRMNMAMRIALIIGIPCSTILYLFAEILTTLIYKSPEAGMYLKIMAPFFLLQYFRIPLQSVLVGLGKANVVMINDFISSIIRLGLIFVLASNSEFGITGVCLAINISIIVGTFLHFLTIAKLIGFNFILTELIKVMLSGVCMGLGALMAFKYLNSEVPNQLLLLGISITISLIIYLILLTCFKVIKLKNLPVLK